MLKIDPGMICTMSRVEYVACIDGAFTIVLGGVAHGKL